MPAVESTRAVSERSLIVKLYLNDKPDDLKEKEREKQMKLEEKEQRKVERERKLKEREKHKEMKKLERRKKEKREEEKKEKKVINKTMELLEDDYSSIPMTKQSVQFVVFNL